MRPMVSMLCFLVCPLLHVAVIHTLQLPNLKPVIKKMVALSHPIRNRTQFGGLFLYELVGENNYPHFNPMPQKNDGSLLFQPKNYRYAPELNLLQNYLVAAPVPKDNNNKQFTHVESFVLTKHGDKLLQAYRKRRNRMPSHAVLYTYFVPCDGCTDAILAFKKKHPYLRLALAFTSYYNKLSADHNYNNLNDIYKAHVKIIHLKKCFIPRRQNKRSTGPSECELNSFQGCLLNGMDNFCCFKNHSDKVGFVNAFAAECFPDYSRFCSDFLIGARFNACSSSTEQLQRSFYNLVQGCSSHALSNPLQVSASNVFAGTLTCPNCLQTPPKTCSLRQVSACGHRETLCTTTAGNSICRDDHYCGLHGESYSWCYIDDEDKWDYCCLGSCKMDSEEDAMMCYTGEATDNITTTQQPAMYRYCGDAGTQTVTGENCDASHPCGTHNGTDYYWCHTQSGLGWDYCCRPDQVCGKKGQDFNWCLVGRNSSRIECNPAREAECDNKTFDEEESCPCNSTCSTQGPASETSTVVAAMPVLVLQSLLVCLVVATRLLN